MLDEANGGGSGTQGQFVLVLPTSVEEVGTKMTPLKVEII